MVKFWSLHHCMTELADMWSYDNLCKTDVVLSSAEAEDLEAAAHFVVEATSWVDWWTLLQSPWPSISLMIPGC